MIGIATVLYFRPKVMFRENGMWKEFGLNPRGDRQTVFPFWMFAIVWAIMSYALGNIISLFFASVVLSSSSNEPQFPTSESLIQPISSAPAMNMPHMAIPAPAVATAPAATAVPRAPGYYILDPSNLGPSPKYIYYGIEPPGYSSGMAPN